MPFILYSWTWLGTLIPCLALKAAEYSDSQNYCTHVGLAVCMTILVPHTRFSSQFLGLWWYCWFF